MKDGQEIYNHRQHKKILNPKNFQTAPFFSRTENSDLKHFSSVLPSSKSKNIKYSKCKLCCLNIVENIAKKKRLERINRVNYQISDGFPNLKRQKMKQRVVELEEEDDRITYISDNEIEKVKNKKRQFPVFEKAFKLMLKLLCDDKIDAMDLEMPDVHKELVMEFMRKKKLCKVLSLEEFTFTTLTTLRDNENARRTEERLKFVFKKCIRYIQSRFKKKMMVKSKEAWTFEDNYSDSVKFDYIFYGHYYNQIAREIGQPIEKFFHFRNWKNRTSEHIPKSITKVYVNYLKMNPKFMNLFITYMNQRLLKDVTLNNIKKLSRLIEDWENWAKKESPGSNGIEVLKRFKAKGLKLPWGLNEVRSAIKDTLGYIIKD